MTVLAVLAVLAVLTVLTVLVNQQARPTCSSEAVALYPASLTPNKAPSAEVVRCEAIRAFPWASAVPLTCATPATLLRVALRAEPSLKSRPETLRTRLPTPSSVTLCRATEPRPPRVLCSGGWVARCGARGCCGALGNAGGAAVQDQHS